MQFIRRLFGGEQEPPPKQATAPCQHKGTGVLAPLWDNPADMGKYDKATGYRCGTCKRVLTLEEAAPLLSTDLK